ncbi:hypothetical protein OV208_05675 [Corallococcus sp. bb12-1]|uniref:hypothetical protein n=1 Tax=Corallococcus sp. bb12-1 TaxID=2996784 RepID=UPI00227145D2|nr:hypothetical protein [Corallococcus sp. bb12-1]MCY1040806.1 hypothetical protein [Corallococcus sp. bb12-1]
MKTVRALSALLLLSCGEGVAPESEGVTPAAQEQAADTFVLRQTKPTAANTGAGVIRAWPTKVINGDVTLSTAGQRLADTLVHGRVFIKAANTVVSNCVVDGGPAMTAGGSIIQIGTGGTNARIEYTTVRAANPTYWVNGIGMREYTAYRVDVSGVVDAFSVAPATANAPVNVSIQGSYGHDLVHFSPDPNHSGSPSRTHNDVLQSHGGSGLEVIGSNFSAYHDPTMGTLPTPNPKSQLSAMMINTIVGPSSNLKIEDNWFGGGVYCINASGATGGGGTFLRNRFDRGSVSPANPDESYTLVFDSTFIQTSTGNVYEDNGHAVKVRTGF